MARRLEDLKVFSKATELSDAVNAILARSVVRRNGKTWNQISEANDSILSNMQEGFEQSSDEGFARYLVYSKGSTAEVVARLRSVKARKQIPAEEFERIAAIGEDLRKMLGGLIKYLRRSGFKDRGSYRCKQVRTNDTKPRTRNQGPGTKDAGPRTRDQGLGTKDSGPRTRDSGPRTRGRGTRDKDSGTRD